jgi:hypothetical protein
LGFRHGDLTYVGENFNESCIGGSAPKATHQSGHQRRQRLTEAHVTPVLDTVGQAKIEEEILKLV